MDGQGMMCILHINNLNWAEMDPETLFVILPLVSISSSHLIYCRRSGLNLHVAVHENSLAPQVLTKIIPFRLGLID